MSRRDTSGIAVPKAFPARLSRWIVAGAAAWTASLVFFIVQTIAQAASARPFSLATNLISDLGNTSCGPSVCSPLYLLVDATFVVVGLCHWFGAAGLRQAWPAGRRNWAATILLSLAGWGLTYAGVFPENVGPIQHRFGALLGLVSLNLGLLILGWLLVAVARYVAVLAIVAGAVGLVGLVFFLTGSAIIPIGIAERLADYPGAATLVVLGFAVLLACRPRPVVRRS
jgi:hypothetical membrane protein